MNDCTGKIIPYSRATDYQSVTDTGTLAYQHDRREAQGRQIADSIENRPLALDSLILTDRGPATAQKVTISWLVLNQHGRGDADMAAVCAVRFYHKNMTFVFVSSRPASQAASQERHHISSSCHKNAEVA